MNEASTYLYGTYYFRPPNPPRADHRRYLEKIRHELGTDSPLHFAPMQRARINCAELPDEDKKRILWANAIRVLKWPEDPGPPANEAFRQERTA